MARHDLRAGLDVVDRHCADHQRHHGVTRDTERQQRNERRLCGSVVRRFRASQAGRMALAEAFRILRDLLFQRVGRERRQHRATARQDTQGRTQGRTAQHGGSGFLEFLHVRVQRADLVGDVDAVFLLLQVGHDFGEAEHAHGHDGEVDTVLQFGNAEVVAGNARVDVGADHAQQQTQDDHRDCLGQRARSQHHGADQAQAHQREVLGGAELERHLSQRGSKRSQQQGRHATGKERAQRGDGQRGARTAIAGHLVTVQHGHHRGRFPWQRHKNRRGRTAVLRTVIDAGQHDQACNRGQHIRDRQQHRDGRDRADARQHANQRTQDAAQQCVGQVLGRERHREAQH
ncbi:hypothetical protein D3C73_802320 [compost metagenome]